MSGAIARPDSSRCIPTAQGKRSVVRWRARTIVQLPSAARANRPQLKRDPLGGPRAIMTSPQLTPVHVYELPDRLFVHSMVRTEAGFLLAVEPALRLHSQATDEELGATVQTLLKSPMRTVPTPAGSDYPAVTRPVLGSGGLKSWVTLERKARLCELVPQDDRILVFPTENGGSRGVSAGFHALDTRRLDLALDASAADLGRAIRLALADSSGPGRGRAA